MVVRPAAATRPNRSSMNREANRSVQQTQTPKQHQLFNPDSTSRKLKPRAFGGNGAPAVTTKDKLVNTMPGADYQKLGNTDANTKSNPLPRPTRNFTNYGDNTTVRDSYIGAGSQRTTFGMIPSYLYKGNTPSGVQNDANNFSLYGSEAGIVKSRGDNTDLRFSDVNTVRNTGNGLKLGALRSNSGDRFFGNYDTVMNQGDNARIHDASIKEQLDANGNNTKISGSFANEIVNKGDDTRIDNSIVNTLNHSGNRFQSSNADFETATINSNGANIESARFEKGLELNGNNATLSGAGSDENNTLQFKGNNQTVRGTQDFNEHNPFYLGKGDDEVHISPGRNSTYSFDGGEGTDVIRLPGNEADWQHEGTNPTHSWNPTLETGVEHSNFERLLYGDVIQEPTPEP